MKRRDFVFGSAGAVLWPTLARAQRAAGRRRVGALIGVAADNEGRARLEALRSGLAALGWKDGEAIDIEALYGEGDWTAIRANAAALVASRPDVIVGNGIRSLTALQEATKTIPIVFVALSDQTATQFTGGFASPVGNVTGFTNTEVSLYGKLFGLLKDMAPRLRKIAFFAQFENQGNERMWAALTTAARDADAEFLRATIRTPDDIEPTIAALSADGAGMVLPSDVFLTTHRQKIIAAAEAHRVPAIYPYRSFVDSGGLMYYGTDLNQLFTQAAGYVDRLLKGARVAELPVQAPKRYQLVVNLKAAKALDLTPPATLLAIADEVIE